MRGAEGAPHIFDVFFVIEVGNKEPEVILAYPIDKDKFIQRHGACVKFCFPEGFHKATADQNQQFAFTLTDSNGTWQHGFCIRTQKIGNALTVIGLLSANYWRILNTALEIARNEYVQHGTCITLEQLYHAKIPAPGGIILDSRGNQKALKRPPNNFPFPDAPLGHLFSAFSIPSVLVLFTCLLEERRVLLCGDDLDVVSKCVFSLVALLTPFQWRGVFIPVLPHDMLDILCAPMPFLIGTQVANLEKAQSLPTEQIVVADVRSGNYVGADDLLRLPGRKSLAANLNKLLSKKSSEPEISTLRSCFVEFFVHMFGKYKAFLDKQDDGNVIFQEEEFLTYLKGKGEKIYTFVEKIRQTQMFDNWRQEVSFRESGKPTDAEQDLNWNYFMDRCHSKYPVLYSSKGRTGGKFGSHDSWAKSSSTMQRTVVTLGLESRRATQTTSSSPFLAPPVTNPQKPQSVNTINKQIETLNSISTNKTKPSSDGHSTPVSKNIVTNTDGSPTTPTNTSIKFDFDFSDDKDEESIVYRGRAGSVIELLNMSSASTTSAASSDPLYDLFEGFNSNTPELTASVNSSAFVSLNNSIMTTDSAATHENEQDLFAESNFFTPMSSIAGFDQHSASPSTKSETKLEDLFPKQTALMDNPVICFEQASTASTTSMNSQKNISTQFSDFDQSTTNTEPLPIDDPLAKMMSKSLASIERSLSSSGPSLSKTSPLLKPAASLKNPSPPYINSTQSTTPTTKPNNNIWDELFSTTTTTTTTTNTIKTSTNTSQIDNHLTGVPFITNPPKPNTSTPTFDDDLFSSITPPPLNSTNKNTDVNNTDWLF